MASSKELGSGIANLAAKVGLTGGRVVVDDSPAGAGWIAKVVCDGATLILDLGRDGFVATITKNKERDAVIDEPELWGAFYPEEKKIEFYLRVFRAYLDGKLNDRLYDPKMPNQPTEPTAKAAAHQ
jgi:hypothetical protein